MTLLCLLAVIATRIFFCGVQISAVGVRRQALFWMQGLRILVFRCSSLSLPFTRLCRNVSSVSFSVLLPFETACWCRS